MDGASADAGGGGGAAGGLPPDVRRWSERCGEDGIDGLRDRRLSGASHRAAIRASAQQRAMGRPSRLHRDVQRGRSN